MAFKGGTIGFRKTQNQLTYKHESSSGETLNQMFHLPIPEIFPVLCVCTFTHTFLVNNFWSGAPSAGLFLQ